MFAPSSINETIKRRYPNIRIDFDNRRKRFVVLETYNKGAVSETRRLWDYENPDGSVGPVSLHVIMEWLSLADTRNWPLEERMKLYDKEREKEKERAAKEFSETVRTNIVEDYSYIANIPTFFMNPAYHFRAEGTPNGN